jgi:hypothetical protein
MSKAVVSGLKRALNAVGLVQNFLILAIVYFVFIGPLALITRMVGCDFLLLRPSGRETFWRERRATEPTLERARRQS